METNKEIQKEIIMCALALREYKVTERILLTEELLHQFSEGSSPEIEETIHKILHRLPREQCYKIEKAYKDALGANLGIVSIFDEIYPAQLRHIYNPPPVLFAKGNLSLLSEENTVAIVGSRRCDGDGIRIAQEFGQELASAGCVVISGLALGIDAAAHTGALQSEREGSTVAVLGNGLPDIWPASNRHLAGDILNNSGLVLSQFDLKEAPYPHNFLDRNRIISGLAKVVLVIQATERSGSLVTARYALEQGREVMAIPGNIKSPRYEGSNRILKEGAGVATTPADILEIMGLHKKDTCSSQISPHDSHPYISIIKDRGELSIEELRYLLNSPRDFNGVLIELELSGRLIIKPGNLVALS